jgi:ERCC4-type nuclease
MIKDNLEAMGVPVEVLNLPLGDVIWVVKRELVVKRLAPPPLKKGKKRDEDYDPIVNRHEVRVLPWMIERKILDDLSQSITDGRYEGQKYRLMRTPGCPHVSYLIEGRLTELAAKEKKRPHSFKNPIKGGFSCVTPNALLNAQVNTQVITGFSAIATENLGHTYVGHYRLAIDSSID